MFQYMTCISVTYIVILHEKDNYLKKYLQHQTGRRVERKKINDQEATKSRYTTQIGSKKIEFQLELRN